MRKMWPVLIGLVVLTSACRLETNLSIDVGEDGSGSFVTELGLDDEMQGLLESFGGSDTLLDGLNLGGSSPTETRAEGNMTYYAATRAFTDVTELQALLNQNQDQVAFDEFQLEVTDDGALLVAKTGPLSDQSGVDLDALPFDPSTLTENNFAANIFVKLPGKVVTHNADEVMADGRLRWSISLKDPLDIEAETSFGGGGIPWLPIGIAALAVLGAGAFLMTRRKDTSAAALSATDVPPAPMGFEATPSSGDPFGGGAELPPELPPALPPEPGS